MYGEVGIMKEGKSIWERRVPLVPDDVKDLSETLGVKFVVQPSSHRIFSDEDYISAGAKLSEDLSGCALVLGIKELPKASFRKDGAYLFFSHTIKGQSYNMPMLKRLMELGCTLLDYERIADDRGRRKIFFGDYAGMAGMVDSLWALGKRLEFEGHQSPLSTLKLSHSYPSLKIAQNAIKDVGIHIKKHGLPPDIRPLVCGFAGYGNVSGGAQKIYDLLQPVEISPEQLLGMSLSDRDQMENIYKVVFREEHMVRPKDPAHIFEIQDYYEHPERYISNFSKYLSHMTILINAIYWSEAYPRLVTKKYVSRLFSGNKKNRLRVIGDISCDIGGAIECNTRATQPDNPIYVYDVDSGGSPGGFKGNGPVILAVDNLPAEFARESSEFFSMKLKDYVPLVAAVDFNAPWSTIQLPNELKRCIILHKGEFTADFEYMRQFIE